MRKFLTVLAILVLCSQAFAYTIEPLTIEEQAVRGANWKITFTYADFTESTTNTAESFTNIFAVVAKQSVKFVGMQLNTAFTDNDTNYTGSTLLNVGDGSDDDIFLASTELNSAGTEVWYKFSPPNAGTIAITRQPAIVTTTTYAAQSGGAYTTTTYAAQTAVVTTMTYAAQTANVGSNGELVVTGFVGTAVMYTVVTNIAGTAVTYVAPMTNIAGTAVSYGVLTNATAAFTASALGQKVYTANDYIDFVFTPSAEEALDDLTAGSVTLFFEIQVSK